MHLDIGVYGSRGIPSTYSGYETFLTTLLPELVERGHRVTTYCRNEDGVEATPWRGVQRKVLPSVPGKNTSTLSHGLVASIAARRAGHDVVLAVNVANAAYTALNRLSGQPVVLNTDGQEWIRDKWGNVARSIFRTSASIARRCATGLIADCRAMSDVYIEEFDAASTVIPYCAPSIEWQPTTEILDRFAMQPNRYLVIAGRHNPENNIHRVAEAVSESCLDLTLAVAGTANYDSPVTARLSELAAADERIVLLGHVDSRQDFLDLLHHATAYVHGHSVGGINPSLIEAMSVGARIIALDTPFNREALAEHGRFFSIEDRNLIDLVLETRTESPAARQEARDAVRDRILEVYGVDSVVDAYESVLIAAASSGRSTGLVVPTDW